MGHRDLRGLVGGFAAVVLITHLWMLPANDDRSSSPHHGATTVGAAATTDAMPMAACPVGMSACTATGVEEPRLPQVAALTTSPALLWVLHVLHHTVEAHKRALGKRVPRDGVERGHAWAHSGREHGIEPRLERDALARSERVIVGRNALERLLKSLQREQDVGRGHPSRAARASGAEEACYSK